MFEYVSEFALPLDPEKCMDEIVRVMERVHEDLLEVFGTEEAYMNAYNDGLIVSEARIVDSNHAEARLLTTMSVRLHPKNNHN